MEKQEFLPDESNSIKKVTSDDILKSVISSLKNMEATLSGEDSPLESVWDEIKEQVQHEESIYWDTYCETMNCLIEGEVLEVIDSDGFEPPPFCDKEDIGAITSSLMDMLLSIADDEPIECAPLDFDFFYYNRQYYACYGKVLKRTGISTCQAMVFSVEDPAGDIETVLLGDIDDFLSEEDFNRARKEDWPEEWE